MFTHIHFQIETVFILAIAALLLQLVRRLNRRMTGKSRRHSTEDDFYTIARITGTAESDSR
jgi:hypothetical protein